VPKHTLNQQLEGISAGREQGRRAVESRDAAEGNQHSAEVASHEATEDQIHMNTNSVGAAAMRSSVSVCFVTDSGAGAFIWSVLHRQPDTAWVLLIGPCTMCIVALFVVIAAVLHCYTIHLVLFVRSSDS